MLKILRKVVEEIMLQGIGDAAQQGNVDVVLAENLVDMRAGAANVVGQLRGRRALLPHHLFDMLPDMHKKRGISSTCRPSGFHAHTTTSYSTPKRRFITASCCVVSNEAVWKMMVKNSF